MSSAQKLSEECESLVCHPCNVDGKTKSVHGFCDTCKHHLCLSCFNSHRVPLVLRDHVMLDENSMPKEKVVPRDPLNEQCEKHGRLLEFYCKKHNDILCSVCVTLIHGNCGVSFIPDESEDVGNSQDFSCLRDNVSKLIERVKRNKEVIGGNKINIEQIKEDTKAQVRHLKEEFVRFFERLELSLNQEIDQIADTDLSRMDEISESCVTMETDLENMAEELDEKLSKKQNNKLFVAMKETDKKMADFLSKIETIDSKNGVTWYRFEPSEELLYVKLSIKALGGLHVRRHNYKVKATHVRNINVRENSDKEKCDVTGLVVIPRDIMVVCDHYNSSVKLIDTKQNTVTSRIRLPSAPWDTALVPRDVTEESSTYDLIVTLPWARKLRYVQVNGDQITDTNKDISVEGLCRGIQVTQDRKLAVCYGNPGKVEILDMDGQVLRRLETDHGGAQLFRNPWYLAVSPGSGILYVSDWVNNTLTSISTRDWSVMTKLEGLVNPQGVTVDRAGSVFVCCFGGTVHLVAATGDRSTQILGKEDGLCGGPQAIGLSPEGDRMYVSGYESDHVQEFQLTESDN